MVTFVSSPAEAVAGVADGATVMIGGFGSAGQPVELVEALIDSGARDLTVVNNNAGNGDRGLAALIRERRVRKIDGRYHVLEHPIRADVALVSAYASDEVGNLVYRRTARNFGPIMAAAATTTVV
jgi:acyl CoA:acetate/3-ketoacid CoA transferase alpha subunit